MYKLLDELINTLERSSVIYDELIEVAKTKQHCLISGDIEELETLIYTERNKAEIARLLEEKRQNITKKYGEINHLEESNITINSLINDVDEQHSRRLEKLVEILTQSLKQLQGLNETNAALTHQSLEITEDIMDIFCPPALKSTVYENTGKMSGSTLTKILIDTKI